MKNMESQSLHWRKSSYSNGSGNECVELAGLDGAVGVRDSKNPEAGVLVLERAAFDRFTRALRSR